MGFSIWFCKFCHLGFGWSSHDPSFGVDALHRDGCKGIGMEYEDYYMSMDEYAKLKK